MLVDDFILSVCYRFHLTGEDGVLDELDEYVYGSVGIISPANLYPVGSFDSHGKMTFFSVLSLSKIYPSQE